MKRNMKTWLVVMGLMLMAAVTPALAQSAVSMRAIVPFSFAALDKQMPAGDYNVVLHGRVVQIACADGSSRTAFIANVKETLKGSPVSKLVFTRYGSHYFLSEIWRSGWSTGTELPKTNLEREIARNGSPTQVAVVLTRDSKGD